MAKIQEMNANKTGLSLGTLFALMHTSWIVLIVLGLGERLANGWYSLHFLSNPFTRAPLDIITVVLGIAIAFASGYAIGWVYSKLWNTLNKK